MKKLLPQIFFLGNKRIPIALKKALLDDSAHLGDGAFSRVVELGNSRVLKLTSCRATRYLLSRQITSPVRALPHVFEEVSGGLPIARDLDGIEYSGYVLERLFHSPTGMLSRLRATQYAAVREQLKNQLAKVEADGFGVPTWQGAVALARALARPRGCRTAYFSHAYERIADCCESTKSSVDFLTQGNILFGHDSRLVLADPVATIVE